MSFITASILSLQIAFSSLTLQQAMEKNIIDVEVITNEKGTHYHDPLIVSIHNKTGSPQSIIIENGLTFTPEDSAYQSIINLRQQIISLSPGQTKTIKLPGMCFNHHKSGPDEGLHYKVGAKATGNLARIATYIEKNNLDGYAVQHAIWAISDNSPLEDIIGWDEKRTIDLTKFVADITGRKMPEPPEDGDYERQLTTQPRGRSVVGGEFTYGLLKDTEIHIAMFNADNIVVRELYYNAAQKPGEHTFEYLFDATVYTDSVYYVRYLENNEVFMEFKIEG